VAAGSDEAERRKYRDAWMEWWKEHGEKLDLARLDRKDPLGYTLVVLLDKGKIMELGPKNQIRWEIGDLGFPLDVQYLPGDRVLVSENQANRVTERNFKGEILWKYEVAGPLMAQRLPNGNTFITSYSQILEVDAKGKQVFSHMRENGSGFMRGNKLPNGDVVCVVDEGLFIRMDSKGKELQSFRVDIQTSGGRIEVLPNGRVLVPQFSTGKVVEMTPDGKVHWEVMAPFDKPIAAVRLANGNTLVTSMPHHLAVELDHDGKVVWEYKTDTRVTRAYRR
jgi:outer membrane protein assembly factor BamB